MPLGKDDGEDFLYCKHIQFPRRLDTEQVEHWYTNVVFPIALSAIFIADIENKINSELNFSRRFRQEESTSSPVKTPPSRKTF